MHLFIIPVIVATLPSLLLGLTWKERLEVTSGLIVEQRPLPIIYETFVPVLLEYKRPIINASDLSTDAIFHRNCSSSDYYPNSPCPTAFYLKEELNRFYNFFTQSHAPSGFSQVPYGQKFNWNDMEETFNVFKSSFATESAVNQYIDQLVLEAPMNSFYLERNIKEFSSINTTNIHNMMSGFYEQYWKEISSDRIDDALYSNAISLYQAMILQQHIMEIVRWNRVMEDCSNFKIPRSFVREDKLKMILNSLRENLTQQSYDLALPVESEYYQHKLASCVTTPTSIFVTIRVPVSKTINITDIQFFRAHSVPFLTPKVANISESICRVSVSNEYFMYNTRFGNVSPSKCQSFQLCSIPREWYYSMNDLCMSADRELNGEEITEHCSMTCSALEDLPLQRFPLITKIGTDKYVLTGRTDGTLVKCYGLHDAKLPENKIGAIAIRIESQCRIQVDQGQPKESLRTFSGSTIIPVHWTVDKKLGPLSSVELNLELLRGTKATGRNSGTPERVSAPDGTVTAGHSTSSLGLGLELVWFSVLTIGLVAGFVYVFLATRKIKDDFHQTGRKESVVYLTSPNASDLLNY